MGSLLDQVIDSLRFDIVYHVEQPLDRLLLGDQCVVDDPSAQSDNSVTAIPVFVLQALLMISAGGTGWLLGYSTSLGALESGQSGLSLRLRLSCWFWAFFRAFGVKLPNTDFA